MSKPPVIARVESIRRQRTLARRADVAGFGFWSSKDVVFSFRPAEDDSGVRFFRSDLPKAEPIPALVYYRIAKPRQTSLALGNAQVDMVEHALAALKGAGIDNCDIVVDAPEAPGMDGSGAPFFDAFLEAGIVEQKREKPRLKVVVEGEFIDESSTNGAKIVARPREDGQTVFRYDLRYDVPGAIPNQTATFVWNRNPLDFRREIANCRTFLSYEEATYLREQGICERVGTKDVLVFGKDGPIDNSPRFDNECARHKILDMIGDFSLTSFDLEGEFWATKTGHQQNAKALLSALENIA